MARSVALTWNLDTGKLSAGSNYLKRAENVSFVLTCYTASAKTLLPTNWALTLALKPKDDFDSAPLIQVTGWTESSSAKTYTSPVTEVSSTAIDTLLAKNSDGTDDIDKYDCNIDVNYTISSLLPVKSNTLELVLKNDVSRSDDATPAAAVVPDDNWVAHGHAQTLTAAQKLQASTNLGLNLTASKLLGQASSGGTGLPVAIALGSGLTMTGSTLSAAGGGSVATDAIFDAKGDLAVGTGADTASKLPVGANDTMLMAASGQATGAKWATPTEVKTALGLVIGTNVQAYDADLTTWAGVTPGTGVTTALAAGASTGGNGAADSGKVAVFNAYGGFTLGKSDVTSTPLLVYGNIPGGQVINAHQYGAGGYIITAQSHANSLGGFAFIGGGISENAVEAVFLATAEGCVGLAVDFSLVGGHATAIGMDIYTNGIGKILSVDGGVYTISGAGVHNFLSVTPAANATSITVGSATHTASAPVFSAVQTWNNGAVTFTAARINVTNTASASGSMLLDLQVAAATKFYVSAGGSVGLGGVYILPNIGGSGRIAFSDVDFYTGSFLYAGAAGLTIRAASQLGFSSTSNATDAADAFLTRAGAAKLQMGADAAGVTNQMFTAANRITSDGVGANLTIAPGNGRGGAGGSLIFSTFTTAAAATAGTLTTRLTLDTSGLLTFAEGTNIALGTSTGTKIGTATNQLLGFYNATPRDQPAGVLDVSTTGLTGSDTLDKTTVEAQFSAFATAINSIISNLESLGIQATI